MEVTDEREIQKKNREALLEVVSKYKDFIKFITNASNKHNYNNYTAHEILMEKYGMYKTGTCVMCVSVTREYYVDCNKCVWNKIQVQEKIKGSYSSMSIGYRCSESTSFQKLCDYAHDIYPFGSETDIDTLIELVENRIKDLNLIYEITEN